LGGLSCTQDGRPVETEDTGQRHVPGIRLRQRRQPAPPPALPRLLGRRRSRERGEPARPGRDCRGGPAAGSAPIPTSKRRCSRGGLATAESVRGGEDEKELG